MSAEFPNVSPAISEAGLPVKQISSGEFQRLLYQWYEEKGLISNLRSHLRVLMINKLRNTQIALNCDQKSTNFTLPKQALSLIVAEHLLRENCHYTLSVFSTEVPIVANQLPFSLYEAHCNNSDWKFNAETVINILELLGITNEAPKIAEMYCNNSSTDSLLICIMSAKKVSVNEVEIETNNEDNYKNYIMRLLRSFGANRDNIETIMDKMQSLIARENETYCENKIKEKNRIINSLKKDVQKKEQTIEALINEQAALKGDNKAMRNELRNMKKTKAELLLQENRSKQDLDIKLDEIRNLEAEIKVSLEKFEHLTCSDKCKENIGMRDKLEKELSAMQESNKMKELEIERLNSKINLLLSDLRSSQNKVEFLNSCVMNLNQMNLQSEALDFDEESSDNVTEEILKQVHSRLSQLEKESQELDVKFKQLKVQ